MKREKNTLKNFSEKKLQKDESRKVKGGYKWVPGMPGGSNSNGLVDWGEMEIRVEPIAAVNWSGDFGLGGR